MTTETLDETIDRTNASPRPPVVFIHGLWLRPSSWDRWVDLFEAAGYAAFAPCWPAEAGGAAAPETIGKVMAHFTRITEALKRRPALIGHSFGGLIAQTLAGHGLSAATVAIDPPPLRDVSITREQFRSAFGNPVAQPESEPLCNIHQAPTPGWPILQAAANLNPGTASRVDTAATQRGPLLVISGQRDNTVPRTVARAYEQQNRIGHAVTEFVQLHGRGHSL